MVLTRPAVTGREGAKMTRDEHNRKHGTNHQPGDAVNTLTRCYGGNYDPDCSTCWLGYAHNWAQHDAAIIKVRRQSTARN